MYETVKLEEHPYHYSIILHRPDKLNALTQQMIEELHNTLTYLKNKPWKIVLMKGAGTSFSTGHDINSELTFNSFEDAQNQLSTLQEITTMITRYPAPVIAALHGYALGAGFEIALNCDLIYATEEAVFGFPELDVGLSITQGTSYFLPQMIGLPKAKELVFLGEKFTASSALELGLINQVFTKDQLTIHIDKVIASLSSKSLHALKEIKSLFNKGVDAPLDKCLQTEANTLIKLLT